jgi:hypothetical protein
MERELGPEDLRAAAAICQETLRPALDRDWSVRAGDLEWDCRRTLDHVVDTLFLYAAYLASRADGRLRPPRNGDPAASPDHLLNTVGLAAVVLAEVARAAPEETRAFHPAGMADIDPWDALRWASGRAALPGRDRLGPDWYRHCAPLGEWDGTIRKRTAPPAW